MKKITFLLVIITSLIGCSPFESNRNETPKLVTMGTFSPAYSSWIKAVYLTETVSTSKVTIDLGIIDKAF